MAGPRLVRHFLDGRVSPRSLVWAYLGALCASVSATAVVLVALLLRYLPHGYVERAGLLCHAHTGSVSPLPVWASPVLPLLAAGILLGLLAYGVVSLCSHVCCSGRLWSEVGEPTCVTGLSVPPRLKGRIVMVDDPAPISYTVGFLRPRVVISGGLLDALGADEVGAVLAHEEGHVAGRDNLLALVAQTLAQTFALVPGVRMAYRRFRCAQERAADAYACRYTGDALVVASSLSKFARSLIAPRPPAAAAAFADDGHVTERIRGLIVDDVVQTSRRRLLLAAACLVLLLATFSGSAVSFSDVSLGGGSVAECSTVHPAGAGSSAPPATRAASAAPGSHWQNTPGGTAVVID